MKNKKQESKAIISWVCLIIFFIAMMFVFAELDDHISTTIYNHDIQDKANTYSDVVSAIGATLVALPIFFAVQGIFQGILITKRISRKNALYWGLNALLIAVCLLVTFGSMITKPHDKDWDAWIVQIVLAVFYLAVMVLYDLWFWNNKRNDHDYIVDHMWLGLRAVLFLITIFVIVNVMKPIFGRPRPVQVLEDGYKFHYPFAISSDTHPRPVSFPSGHAITASSLSAITLMYFRKPSWERYSINTSIAILAMLVCIARILGLHHWASDTFMSLGIGTVAYCLYSKLFNKKLIKQAA